MERQIMDFTLVGYVAAFCTTVSFIPQVLKTWKTKSTKDLSLPMYLILAAGTFLWAIYGFSKQDPAIILANGIVFFLSLLIISIKIKNG